MTGEAEEQPRVLKMSPASWHEVQKQVLYRGVVPQLDPYLQLWDKLFDDHKLSPVPAPCKHSILKG